MQRWGPEPQDCLQVQVIAPDRGAWPLPALFPSFRLTSCGLSNLVTRGPRGYCEHSQGLGDQLGSNAPPGSGPSRGQLPPWPTVWPDQQCMACARGSGNACLSGTRTGVLRRKSSQKKPRSLLCSRSTVSVGSVVGAPPPWGALGRCRGLAPGPRMLRGWGDE